jgi:hypothetical protein
MNKKGIVAILIIIGVIFVLAASVFAFRVVLAPKTDEEIVATETSAPTAEKSTQFTWIVKPTHEYYQVFYDTACDVILAQKTENGEIIDIDPATGEKAPNKEHGHDGGDTYLAYNNIMKKFGIYDSYRLSARFNYDTLSAASSEYNGQLETFTSMKPVLTIDSPKNILGVDSENADDGVFEINIGKIAYAYQNKLVTDYIFDDADTNLSTINPAVKKDGKWGFIDETGKVIIDYQFEEAASYDNTRAFVKLDGKWGIILKMPLVECL